jgi:Protein of unknown function (DUF2478)
MAANGDTTPCALAAVVFGRDEDPDAALRAFVERQAERGWQVGGLLQQQDSENCACHEVHLVNLDTGQRIDIMQDLGRDAASCRLDPSAIAAAAQEFRVSLARRPDLIVANRFGKLEAEGGGLIAEIGEAVAEGAPLIVCVAARFLDAWNAFADGLDTQLPPRQEAIEAWWAALAPRRASAA